MAKTYNELYLTMRRALKEAGLEDFALEARRLLAQAAGYTDAQLIARFYLYAGDEAERKAAELLERRLKGEPLAHISGSWDFYGARRRNPGSWICAAAAAVSAAPWPTSCPPPGCTWRT